MPPIAIRPLTSADREHVEQFMIEHWGDSIIVGHGTVYTPADLSGFVAEEAGAWVGLLTYLVEAESCEVVTLDSLRERQGVGTGLIEAVKQTARDAGCRRLWLITTNDNLHALRFYQRRGFALVVLHRNAVERARALKPTIPLLGNDGIPIRDEIELEMLLD